MTLRETVRLAHVDAPELRGACPLESALAASARQLVMAAAGAGNPVTLGVLGRGKYGRILATVTTERGQDLGRLLLDAGLARPYEGGKREGWCGD